MESSGQNRVKPFSVTFGESVEITSPENDSVSKQGNYVKLPRSSASGSGILKKSNSVNSVENTVDVTEGVRNDAYDPGGENTTHNHSHNDQDNDVPEPDYVISSDDEASSTGKGLENMNQPPPPPPGHNNVYPSLSIGFEDVSAQVPAGAAMHRNTEVDSDGHNRAFEVDVAPTSSPIAMDATENTSLVKEGERQQDTTVDMGVGDPNDTPDTNTLLFRDGQRKIDYILAYLDHEDSSKNEKREMFLRALREEGLHLETEDKQDGKTYFVKVFMPWRMCLNHAELLKLKMPIQANDIDAPLSVQCFQPCGPCRPNIEEEEDYFTAPFFKGGEFIGYEGPQKENLDFFTPAQRGRMVFEVLQRARYGDQKEQFGVKRLLRQGVFSAAYPLHSGSYKVKDVDVGVPLNSRQQLYYEWARPGAFMKEQPYDAIRAYFGEKVAIYFSWLGFYTIMLVPASIVGLIVFIIGLAGMMADTKTNELCDSDLVMCPSCDKRCNYTHLKDSCFNSRMTFIVDNPATIFFAIFMALWTSFFIEFWKRHQARLQYDWDVSDYEETEQNIRPEFEASVTSKKKNPITHDYEPDMRGVERCIRVGSSLSLILFMICVVLGVVFGVVIYRMVVVALIYGIDNQFIQSRARLITSITAGVVSFVFILILNKVYEKIAIGLTNMETWKYQSEWEDAFTFKMYIFQFVNYYGAIMYIAFFKGQGLLIGRPGDFNRILGARVEECDPSGCLLDLFIQLLIIMVGKQMLNNGKEILVPFLLRFIKSRRGRQKIETDDDKYTSWERDYDLVDFPIHGLYEEYLEMVIQYGFVTLFVAAFPLAPFFALLNNIMEVRLDAIKLVTQFKRPMAERAQDIGTWFFILQVVSKIAIIFNAVIIAFTSDFIKKSLYNYMVNNNATSVQGVNYVEWSLSKFDIKDFNNNTGERPSDAAADAVFPPGVDRICRYRDFRAAPGTADAYEYTTTYWHILTAQLAFIIVFEHAVLGIAALINFLIPDVPIDIRDRTLREKHLAKIAQHERIKKDGGKRRDYTGSSTSVQHATSL